MSIDTLNRALKEAAQGGSTVADGAAGTDSLDEVLVSDLYVSSFDNVSTTAAITMIDAYIPQTMGQSCANTLNNCASVPIHPGATVAL